MRRLVFAFVLLSLAFAPAPMPRKARGPQGAKRLQGGWVRSSRTLGMAVQRDIALSMHIEGDRLRYYSGKGNFGSWQIVLGSGDGLATIDRYITAKDGQTFRWLGLYGFRGNSLVICWTRFCNPASRPRSLEPGDEVEVEVYERVR